MQAWFVAGLLTTVALSGCAVLDAIAGDCGPDKTVEHVIGSTPILEAHRNDRGHVTWSWTLQVANACPREHARATAEMDVLPKYQEACRKPEVISGAVHVSPFYEPYNMDEATEQSNIDGTSRVRYWNDDIGLAQAYGENEPASYSVRFSISYEKAESDELDLECASDFVRAVKLTSTYAEFAPKE